MAFIIGNDWNKPSKKLGFIFEHQVFEHLRVNLPSSYGILHSAIVVHRADAQHGRRNQPGRPRPREVDFLVAGPNGLFLIEAKSQDSVRGGIFGTWAFGRKNGPTKVAEGSSPERFGLKMKENMIAAHRRVLTKGGPRLEGFKHVAGIFVFRDDAEVEIYDENGTARREFYNDYFVRKVSELSELIQRHRPSSMLGTGPRAPTAADVGGVLDIFEPGLRLDPNVSGDYTILEFGSSETADNGLPYSVCKLRHNTMDYIRRGKWYDMAAVGEKDRQLFLAQIKRHALVLGAARGQGNVNRYYEFSTDTVGSGYCVIEEWVDGAPLEVAMRSPGKEHLKPLDIMRQVGLGVAAIHAGGFVCRCLRPSSILIDDVTKQPILTNFEMAKAVDGGPTVTAGEDLPADPYRAPEIRVSGAAPDDKDIRGDLFSWGAIFYKVVTGQEPPATPSVALLEKAPIPSKVVDLVKRCLSPMKSQRPASMGAVLQELESAL